MPNQDIWIDKDGAWFYQGREIIHPEILSLFKSSLTLGEDGRYFLLVADDCAEIDVEDTPFFVCRVDAVAGKDGLPRILNIVLDDGVQELLDIASIRIAPDNIPYCRVKKGLFPAKFHKRAYYQLAEFIAEDEQGFYLELEEGKHYLQAAGKE